MDFASEERLTVADHPLIEHKLSVIRNEDTPDYLFRQTVREITLLEGYAATQDLATRSVEVKTPIATCECESIRGIEPVVVPILRAGLGMLDGMLDLIPTAPVAHLGMYRDEITHEPHENARLHCRAFGAARRSHACYRWIPLRGNRRVAQARCEGYLSLRYRRIARGRAGRT